MVEQDDLNRNLLLATVRKILENSQFRERAKQVQEDVMGSNGLEIAVQTIVATTEGGIADVSS